MFKKQNRKQIFIHCLIKYLMCTCYTPGPAGPGSKQTTRSLPSWTCLMMTWTLNKEDTQRNTVTTCSMGYGGKEQRSPHLDHEGQGTHLRWTFKMAKGLHAVDRLPLLSSLILLSISLQTDTCLETHSLTLLALSPKPMSSKPGAPMCKQMTLRASISKQGKSWAPDRGQHVSPWSGSHKGSPFMIFESCLLSPEVSVSPICQME